MFSTLRSSPLPKAFKEENEITQKPHTLGIPEVSHNRMSLGLIRQIN